jgi:transcriptional regulator with XRE-family HTH domain
MYSLPPTGTSIPSVRDWGLALRQRRLALGHSQETVAQRAAVSVRLLRDVEHGRRPEVAAAALLRLSSVLAIGCAAVPHFPARPR